MVAPTQAGFKQPAQYATKQRSTLQTLFDEAAPSSVKEPVDKVDMADVNDAQAVVPYLGDIHRHYREAEVRAPPRARAVLLTIPRKSKYVTCM